MEKIGKDGHQNHTSYNTIRSCATSPWNYSSDHHNRQSDQNPDVTTTSAYHQRPSSRPDHQIRSSDPFTTANPDYQIRSPHKTTGHHPWLFSFQSAQPTQPLEMVQVRCILYGLGQGRVYKELDEPCKAYFPHTFDLKIRLNLMVV